VSAPTCTLHQLGSKGAKAEQGPSDCPAETVVGHIRTYPAGFLSANSAIYNIVPEHGVASEFGFVSNANTPIVLYASVAPTCWMRALLQPRQGMCYAPLAAKSRRSR
jgi:hypothetical protein